MSLYDYDRWENFSREELACQFTGRENPNTCEFIELMDRVQELRDISNIPLPVTSGYRDPSHPLEAVKEQPGMHTLAAVDIWVSIDNVYNLVELAFELGFTGIGIHQEGDPSGRFIHLDLREIPRLWSY